MVKHFFVAIVIQLLMEDKEGKFFNISTHKGILKTKKNKKNLHQTFVLDCPSTSASQNINEFTLDLSRAFIKADLPFYKINNPAIIEFLEKYTKEIIPDESTLRKNYLKKNYEETLNKIRAEIQEGPIWVTIDETTDVEGRHIGNVVIGLMDKDKPTKPYLLTCEVIPKCNYQTIGKLFNDAMQLLWPEKIRHLKVFVLITDAAPYMIKAAKSLTVLYNNMIHKHLYSHT
jgi:hypothetical protein